MNLTISQPISDERSLRSLVRANRAKSTILALLIYSFDLGLYGLATYQAVTSRDFRVAILWGTVAGIGTAMLFVVGHDACHGSFTRCGLLNGWIGRVAFLPSLTPFGSWAVAHNQTHHVYTNWKPLDYVWAPLSKAEYDALPLWRRLRERLYRTPVGVGAYYGIEIWWRRLIAPPGRRSDLWMDCGLCWGYACVMTAIGLAFGAKALLAGVVWPFVCWNWLMGWAIFEHHTHPQVPWFTEEAAWRAARAQSRCTVHVILPKVMDLMLHNIMQHSAHHLDVTIPLYHLAEAQTAIETAGAGVVNYRWTPLTFFRHLRMCKLYDFEARAWLDFDGNPTDISQC